jgi:hypothetical protein
MKKLFLEKRGCDFFTPNNLTSDVGNYRVTTRTEEIRGKDGNLYFLEFTLWENRGHYRKISKYGNKELLHPVWEIDIKEALAISTQYTNEKGSWGNIKLEKELGNLNLTYTQKDILEAVNFISKDKYNKIIFID